MDITRIGYTTAVASVVTDRIDAAGKSHLRISEETGIPRTTLARRLSGASPFTVAELSALAAALGTTPSALVADAEKHAVAAA